VWSGCAPATRRPTRARSDRTWAGVGRSGVVTLGSRQGRAALCCREGRTMSVRTPCLEGTGCS
jgi:hypothetical protein